MGICSFESLAMFGYGIAIVISAQSDTSRGIVGATSAPIALLITYALIAAVLGVIARGLWQGNSSARSAFVLSQCFSIVIAQTLFAGSEEWERWMALGLVASAIFSGVALLSKPVREHFA